MYSHLKYLMLFRKTFSRNVWNLRISLLVDTTTNSPTDIQMLRNGRRHYLHTISKKSLQTLTLRFNSCWCLFNIFTPRTAIIFLRLTIVVSFCAETQMKLLHRCSCHIYSWPSTYCLSTAVYSSSAFFLLCKNEKCFNNFILLQNNILY